MARDPNGLRNIKPNNGFGKFTVRRGSRMAPNWKTGKQTVINKSHSEEKMVTQRRRQARQWLENIEQERRNGAKLDGKKDGNKKLESKNEILTQNLDR